MIHGLLDRVMQANGFTWKEANDTTAKAKHYYLQPSTDAAFFPNRRADVIANGQKIGVIGVLHPQVLENYKIPFPCSALEICIEQFV